MRLKSINNKREDSNGIYRAWFSSLRGSKLSYLDTQVWVDLGFLVTWVIVEQSTVHKHLGLFRTPVLIESIKNRLFIS